MNETLNCWWRKRVLIKRTNGSFRVL